MSNKNPSPATRFKPGQKPGPGRTAHKADRDRITAKFLQELAQDFDANGKRAIVDVRTEDPGRYLTIVASLVPKEVEIKSPLHALDDATLAEIVEKLRAVLPQMPPPTPDDAEHQDAVH
jgi:hypothetical protein